MCLGSDKSSGGAHGVLGAEVDIVLLLPVDPVGPWALPVQGKTAREGYKEIRVEVSYASVNAHSDAIQMFFY